MKIYSHKKSWKFILFVFAVIIVIITFWATNSFVQKLAREEKAQIEIWAKAISRKAQLVKYTENLFTQLTNQEKKYVQQWADATKKLIQADSDDDISFYTEFINGNDNIPVIVTDESGNVTAGRNLSGKYKNIDILNEKLRNEFTEYEAITVNYYQDKINYIYYRNSKLYVKLKNTLDDLVSSFLNEVVENSLSNEVIIVDSSKVHIIAFSGDIDTTGVNNPEKLNSLLNSFDNKPIKVNISIHGDSYIYYKDSFLLQQASYFPIFLFSAMAIFLLVSYILFSLSRNAEQNLVWVGLAKETAHQLGTPLSSLLGWIEMLKLKMEGSEALTEMENDVNRLKLISERFSKIGSKPELTEENLSISIDEVVEYIRRRINSEIKLNFYDKTDGVYIHKINKHLFAWVLENLLKNSVDALQNKKGIINVSLQLSSSHVFIDVEDNGKGIQKGNHKSIFKPGYTTKNRGWGLGLSLAKRIIKNYHKGKIFVKSSVPDKSTIIRISLKKENN